MGLDYGSRSKSKIIPPSQNSDLNFSKSKKQQITLKTYRAPNRWQ